MKFRKLGNSGLWLSALSFGSWVTFKNQVDEKLAKNLMAQAHDNGINFFDNAEVYGAGESERLMGQTIRDLGWSRDSFCVSSKVFWGGELPTQKGLSRKHVFDACHAALKRLQVDYLDLFYCHRPDYITPVEETVRAMSDLVTQGKIMYWGTSEWPADRIVHAHAVARQHSLVAPSMEQPQYNLFHRDRVEAEYELLYSEFGMGTTVWSPLASGLLSGKYNDGIPENSRADMNSQSHFKKMLESPEGQAKIAKVKKLSDLAKEFEVTSAQLAIAWCLRNPKVSSVITGASNEKQLQSNLDAIEALSKLSGECLQKIEDIFKNQPDARPRFL